MVRVPVGLALSSRTRYLAGPARARARAIVLGLRAAHDAYAGGERTPEQLVALARAPVEAAFDRIDYVAAVHPETLAPLAAPSDALVLLVAAHLGTTRLIDNLQLGRDPRP
jgi:pantothenate synthetase